MKQGGFPVTYAEVRALKGVGDYTAAAICSFAYNLPYAVVDGNVYRVLTRLHGVDTPIDTTSGKKFFATLAQEMLDKRHPALYNQAVMEFGALHCTPQNPACLVGPFSEGCVAFRSGRVEELPVKSLKTKTSNRYFNYLYIRAGAYIYIRKRVEKDIWHNLYELPLIETNEALDEASFYKLSELRSLFPEGNIPVFRCVRRGVKHILSHRIIYANFYEVHLPADTSLGGDFLRINEADITQYALPRLIEAFLQKN